MVGDLYTLHLQDRSCFYETVCAAGTLEMMSGGSAEPHDFVASFMFRPQIVRVLSPKLLLDREVTHADALLDPEACCREVPDSAETKAPAHPDGCCSSGFQCDSSLPRKSTTLPDML